MAIISFTNYKRGQTTGCMRAVMRYTMQDTLGKHILVIDGLRDVLKELKANGKNLNNLDTLAKMGRLTVI